ncbi:Metacaspase-1B [Psilocybe cubensis]|uniref:Metacaspase-1B n=1 Tax=Psilocybe cubensis TaxID=181762 RepID=A0ACB8HHP8_PSICU|nr:Metacaspase-1B [Psilocybe cubensis]KAH9487448.1 Metacaspase-1B [Psilocybe cubensis]
MMWDFRGRSQEDLQKGRGRSKSPQPPPMRMPSPSQANSHSPSTYSYGVNLTPSYQASPTFYPPARSCSRSPSPYSPHRSHDYGAIPRSIPTTQNAQYIQPTAQIVHVIHHSSHHHHHSSSSKHKHKPHHHHNYSYSYTPAPSAPITPITPSTSYYSAPVIPKPPRAPSPRVHFPTPSQIATSEPSMLHVPPRGRVHSQPTMPTSVHRPAAAPVQRPVQQTSAGGLNPQFQYSKCTGRKKALCIGINYRGQPNELRGCINDAKNVRNFLIR